MQSIDCSGSWSPWPLPLPSGPRAPSEARRRYRAGRRGRPSSTSAGPPAQQPGARCRRGVLLQHEGVGRARPRWFCLPPTPPQDTWQGLETACHMGWEASTGSSGWSPVMVLTPCRNHGAPVLVALWWCRWWVQSGQAASDLLIWGRRCVRERGQGKAPRALWSLLRPLVKDRFLSVLKAVWRRPGAAFLSWGWVARGSREVGPVLGAAAAEAGAGCCGVKVGTAGTMCSASPPSPGSPASLSPWHPGWVGAPRLSLQEKKVLVSSRVAAELSGWAGSMLDRHPSPAEICVLRPAPHRPGPCCPPGPTRQPVLFSWGRAAPATWRSQPQAAPPSRPAHLPGRRLACVSLRKFIVRN
ncbi:uncharacterized protein LOC116666559 [Camelus ferus]|uniref:Uncharacterized protein LOC116666559 n=1 Tax=Camelus ferus TaxID=419612 RepID=A0A8B8TV15_CAMFR|nr:uncharacterized protein LOC116666559 [Camelus ferus]